MRSLASFFLRGLCGAITWTLGTAFAPAASSVRVAVLGPEAPESAAVVAAEISQMEGIEVVERGQIKLLLGEQALGASSRERLALGRLLSVDLLLLVGPEGDSFTYVDARTGEELLRLQENSPDALARSALALVEKLRKADQAVTAAVSDDGETREAASVLRDWLRGEGLRVLDRTLSREVLEERASSGQGMRENADPLPAFPGADLLFKVRRSGERFHVETLSASGALLGVSPPWRGASAPSPEARVFLQPLLRPHKDTPPSPFRQRVNIEALQPFFRGVALYEAGRPLEATAEFQKANERNNLFAPAYLWEARCYEAAGLPELAVALRRWLATGFAGRGVAAGADATARDGVTFLGVTAGEEKDGPTATRLSMAAIDALSGPELFLPESLGAIRDEYDLLAGASHTEGARWETSSGFVSRFTLRGFHRQGVCHWTLADSLTGKTIGQASFTPVSNPAHWAAQIRDLNLTASARPTAPESMPLSLPSKEEALATWQKTTRAADKNVALLQLTLLDPGNPLVIGGRLRKGGEDKDGLEAYLAYGRREALLRLLPADHAMRSWLELDRIQNFLPWDASGPHHSGEKRDYRADLLAFSEAVPDHPARALARYFWLYDQQDELPHATIVAEAEKLSPRLARADGLPNGPFLGEMAASLGWLARVASGESGLTVDKGRAIPRNYRMEIKETAEVVTYHPSIWIVNDYTLLRLSPEELRHEAGAALAIQGRGDFRRHINPAWMERFPRSFSLASFLAFRSIYDLPKADGAPLPFAGDSEALRKHWRRMIDYTADTLEHHLSRVGTSEEFRALDYPLQYFFHGLHGGAFRLSDADYEAIRQRFLTASAAAAKRAGVPDQAPRVVEPDILDWRRLTREETLRQTEDSLGDGPWFYRDGPAVCRRVESAAVAAFDQDPPSFRPWWELMHRGLDESFSYREIAAKFVLPHLPKIRAIYGTGSLSDDERAMLLDVGIVLMWGWQLADAESIIQLVIEAPPSVTSSDRLRRALQASALFHLARLQVQANDKPAAIASLTRCGKFAEGLDIRQCQRFAPNFRDWIINPPGQRNHISSLALRLLDELRFDPAHAVFPERCGAVQVPTRQLDNVNVTVFYRLPPPSTVPPRVLVVLPNFNDGVARFCEDTHPLARFCDTHNLALIVPQFFQAHTFWRKDHPCSPYHYPNLWSGQTLLDAIAKIGRDHKLDGTKLLFHGLGSGAHFASRFARWKPERTGALSLHGGSGYAWAEREGSAPLGPTSVLAGLPVLLTTGETEDFGASWSYARAASEAYATILQGAGAEVDFHIIDTTSHSSTPHRQTLVEHFLTRYLKTAHP